MNTERYSTPARLLHWLIAVLAVAQIALGFVTDNTPREEAQGLQSAHAQLGLLILSLMVLRIAWRVAHPPPRLAGLDVGWRRTSAAMTHGLLYALLLLMPLTGLVLWLWMGRPVALLGWEIYPAVDWSQHDEFWRSVAGYFHEYGSYSLVAAILLHLAAAGWHEFIRKDGLIRRRML